MGRKDSLYGVRAALKRNFGRVVGGESSDRWVSEAAQRVMGLLDEHHAVYQAELIARLSPESGPYWDSGQAIEPAVVGETVNALVDAGHVLRVRHATRGGREVLMIVPAGVRRRATAVDRAVARKSLLVTRYDGWAQSSQRYPRGRIGPAGEAAAADSIRRSRCMVEGPETSERTGFGGYTFAGPVDWIGTTHSLAQGRIAVVLVEVKNVRSWIYPHSQEPYQLLAKAVGLQAHLPTLNVVPVLVCRRANRRMYAMAQHLGFFVVQAEEQPTGLPASDEDAMMEVRSELGFHDLRLGNAPIPAVSKRFVSVHKHWPRFADRWKVVASDHELVAGIQALSEREIFGYARTELKHELGERAAQVMGAAKSNWWAK